MIPSYLEAYLNEMIQMNTAAKIKVNLSEER